MKSPRLSPSQFIMNKIIKNHNFYNNHNYFYSKIIFSLVFKLALIYFLFKMMDSANKIEKIPRGLDLASPTTGISPRNLG